jgi:putative nucleotidyltransferase with HDIG domain
MEEELRQDEVSLEKVAGILERDLAMSAKVLQLVNSAFFGLTEEVTEISEAVRLLGVDIVKSLALANHVFLEWEDLADPRFSHDALYDHSLEVAALSRKLAQQQGCDQADVREIYAAGLFHDLGKLVMAANMPELLAEVGRLTADNGTPRVAVEKRIMGATHAEIGAYLLVLWGLPDDIVNAAAYHHSPGRADAGEGFNAVTAVHVANALVHEGYGAADRSGSKVDEEYLGALGLADQLTAWRELQ